MKNEIQTKLNLFEDDTSFSTKDSSPKYALALVNITGLGVKTFSYSIPDEMKNKLQIGQAILVPFGRQGLKCLRSIVTIQQFFGSIVCNYRHLP